jgi:type 2 lantibiotic biosynthesis protein LanM
MTVSQRRFIRRIAARAAPAWDRFPVPDSADSEGDVTPRLERWAEVLGSSELLRRRMRTQRAGDASAVVYRNRIGRLPGWTRTFAACLFEQHTARDRPMPRADAPFAELFEPFLLHARRAFLHRAGTTSAVLTPAALDGLERQLLEHLSFVASLSLGQVFYEFRFRRAPLSAFETIWLRQPDSHAIYDAFISEMRGGGLAALFDSHPVLARLLAQSVDQWVESSATICARFSADWLELCDLFGWPRRHSRAAICHVSSGLSDRHSEGQTVAEVVVRTGERLIYKPRSIRPDLLFQRVLEWVGAGATPERFKTFRGLDRAAYGWVEAVSYEPVDDDEAAVRFYRRAGKVLAALHALAVTDIHCENMIAAGEFPVVVDAETLMSETPRHPRKSVLDTGFLRRLAADADVSALGAGEAPANPLRFPTWHRINTDQMTLTESSPVEPHQHRLRVGDRLVNPADHIDVICDGFREAYMRIMNDHEELFRGEWVGCFKNLPLRVLVRDTATYAQIQLHLLHPEYLGDGIDRSIELEWLARPLCTRKKAPPGRLRLYEHERKAMEQLDIPRIDIAGWRRMGHLRTSEEALAFDGGRGERMLRNRLARLSPRDCSRQVRIIARSLS